MLSPQPFTPDADLLEVLTQGVLDHVQQALEPQSFEQAEPEFSLH